MCKSFFCLLAYGKRNKGIKTFVAQSREKESARGRIYIRKGNDEVHCSTSSSLCAAFFASIQKIVTAHPLIILTTFLVHKLSQFLFSLHFKQQIKIGAWCGGTALDRRIKQITNQLNLTNNTACS